MFAFKLLTITSFPATHGETVFTAKQCERRAKTDKFCSVFISNRISVNGTLFAQKGFLENIPRFLEMSNQLVSSKHLEL